MKKAPPKYLMYFANFWRFSGDPGPVYKAVWGYGEKGWQDAVTVISVPFHFIELITTAFFIFHFEAPLAWRIIWIRAKGRSQVNSHILGRQKHYVLDWSLSKKKSWQNMLLWIFRLPSTETSFLEKVQLGFSIQILIAPSSRRFLFFTRSCRRRRSDDLLPVRPHRKTRQKFVKSRTYIWNQIFWRVLAIPFKDVTQSH